MDVRVMMTHAATRFVAPLTFETLSGHPVHLDDEQHLLRSDSAITHVEEGNAADIMVVAPATANTLAKMANGYADNLLTATYLAYAGTVVVAPSMNTNMWGHPATQQQHEHPAASAGSFVRRTRRGGTGLRCLRLGPHGRTRTASWPKSSCACRSSARPTWAGCG